MKNATFKSRSLCGGCLLLIVCLYITPISAQQLSAPGELGPYAVGVTTLQLDDHARKDSDTGNPRTLLTEIWYPTVDAARNLPKNKYSDFIFRGTNPEFLKAAEEGLSGYRENFKIADLPKEFENEAYRDAPVKDGHWPLIVFSHGSGGTRVGYIFFVEHMASHGYVVMAADHTGNSRFTFSNGKVIKRGGPRAQSSAVDRPHDVSFLIDSMELMSRGTDGRFAGRVDTDRIGVAGMSFGGSTTMNVLNQDDRVDAGVMLAPGGPSNRSNYTTPNMMIIATEDATVGERGNSRSRQYYEESKGPRYLVELKDAGHFTFTSVEKYNPNFGNGIGTGERITKPGEPVTYLEPDHAHEITNAYSLAFFNVYVLGDDRYEKYLSENHYDDEIIYKK